MDLAYSKEDEAFRQTVRTWLKANVPKKDKSLSDLPPNDPQPHPTCQGLAAPAV